MGLKNMSILASATISASGGSAFVFADDGVTVQNGVHLIVPGTADYRVRESATFKYKPPSLTVDGAYTRDKKSVSFNVPLILASGKVVNNVIRVEREVHPELSSTEVIEINKKAAQLLVGSDTSLFWSAGSLS